MTSDANDMHGRTVSVDLGPRSYQIRIGAGLVERAGAMISALRPATRCAIVTDKTVAGLHLDALRHSLESAGLETADITIPPGETSKSLPMLQRVVDAILSDRLERGDLVMALGGGVVGDLAGFAAAITRRGMDFVQIPTSLLAQVDSSVGGKTGINAAQGKNLIGAFHQPILVIADTDMLKTLPAREFRAGYAEIAKYGLIDRPDFFEWLDQNLPDILAQGPSLAEAIAQSCLAKAAIVATDEREASARALLNLGHTFGHALEAATGFDPAGLVHGEAVAIGMVLAHRFSARMNLASTDDAARVAAHLERAGLPTDLSVIRSRIDNAERLMEFIAHDKKVSRGELTFILTRGIGKAFLARDVPAAELRTFLADTLES